jgi:fructosamine-3-kinase
MGFEVNLPAALLTRLAATLGAVVETVPVGGGDISSAARIRWANGDQALIKWRSGPPAGLFSAEQRGLALLRSAGALRVPQVLAHSEAENGSPAFIVLEWLGDGLAGSSRTAEALGRGLAALHRVTGPAFGLDHDNFIGDNPQPNRPNDNWVAFFREQRLGFQLELAAQRGRLPGRRAKRLEKLLARLGDWLPKSPPASLLHGDLWGGNWLVTDTHEPALIDPAVYYGHHEAELAFTELFGGFPQVFYLAYNQAWPLDQAYAERRDLYNLYHLLNHLNLFGESYGSGVDSILGRYISG